MTALDVKQAKQALSWRLAQWGVTLDVEGKAASFIDDLVFKGWQMAPEKESRPRPPKQGEQCPTCNRAMHAPDVACAVPVRSAREVGARPTPGYLAARRASLGLHEPSPAPGACPPEPAVDDASAGPDASPQDVQQRAGEPDLRPETACSADGCFRPTTQGICDRCREAGVAEDIDAANAELVDRLKAAQRERAHDRPAPDPEPPRRFTSADINHDHVRAAMARRTEGATT